MELPNAREIKKMLVKTDVETAYVRAEGRLGLRLRSLLDLLVEVPVIWAVWREPADVN